MITRPLVPADAEAIHTIHSLCLERTLLGRYTREQIEAWKTRRFDVERDAATPPWPTRAIV